ncbi:hypothetical protein [Desertimonas flava]|jgi:5-methyltetrahydropteroyltriglutamate--homocysteine methyltransferase|uniref:hypothetical protein n=1 Tax=Desertimonas flava TaxID=2064846 RepID=UPI000E34BF7F|nr:hypothetical protein [Desertimonas flava]
MTERAHRIDPATLLMPTAVVGSHSVPEWLERLRTDHYQGRISSQYLREIHDVAVKAAIKDQERAGIDIVTDGEQRRDNDVDYFLTRVPGVEIPHTSKSNSFDYFEARVTHPLPVLDAAGLGLGPDVLFTREQTDRPVKFSITGPYSLSRRISDDAYGDRAALVRALGESLNAEARDIARLGADVVQIDEPFLAGYPQDVEMAIEGVNTVMEGVDAVRVLHVCYGNRYARPMWEGHYDFLFPAVLDAHIDQLALEFARKGDADLQLFGRHKWDRGLGLGVIDVKSDVVESPGLVAERIHRALDVVTPDRLTVNPDCGLRHVPSAIAVAKLRAMVAGTAMARADVCGVDAPIV